MEEIKNASVWTWVLAAVAVVLVILGFWWWNMGQTAQPTATGGQPVATTTPAKTNINVETRLSSTVAQVVASLSGAPTFQGIFVSTGVSASLTGKGPYTVFVPTDAGFTNITPGTISTMTAAEKKRLVQYHVVSGKMLDIDAIDNGTIQALSKDMLNFIVNDNGTVQVNSSYALKAYKASNGIVYTINAPLIPPIKTQ